MDYRYENRLRKKGYRYIAGLDEAGRGAWAGPLVASAVILNSQLPTHNSQLKVKDSKLLNKKQREELFKVIKKQALAYSIVKISSQEIDRIGLGEANKLIFEKAVKKLKIKPDFLLIDALKMNSKIPSKSIVKADRKILSCACASILAKVYRDRMMKKLAKKYPKYGFEKNKGYGTKEHLKAIKKFGICPLHRKSFSPIKKYC